MRSVWSTLSRDRRMTGVPARGHDALASTAPMELLLIGGGIFLGASLVEASLARGHRLTVFNRGRSRSDWPGDVEVLVGDRCSDLGRLAGRRFDAVHDGIADELD